MTNNSTIQIYYDGMCHLCSREIEHYKNLEGSENFIFVDITHPKFEAEKEGLNPIQVHKVMHVKNSDGQIKTGVEAFILIWENLSKYKRLSKLSKKPLIKPILSVCYYTFAFLRPYLPKKKSNCEQSPYCESRSNLNKKNKSKDT